jgi:hypothetical protein
MSGIDLRGRAGFSVIAEGGDDEFRMGRTREMAVADAHGRYFEVVRTGRVYTASTAAAGVAPGTALSTTPPLTLWNGASGIIAAIIGAMVGYVSGTIGAGTLALATTAQSTKPTGGTALTVQSNRMGDTSTGQILAFSGSTLTAAPTLVAPVAVLNATLATAPSSGGFPAASPTLIELGSLYHLWPGNAACLQGIAAAGSTPLVILALCYEVLEIQTQG